MILLILTLICNTSAIKLNTNEVFSPKDHIEESVCFTTECVLSASRIRAWMNETYNPCNDFYNFICGGYANINNIDKSFTPFTSLNHHILQQIAKVLEENQKDNDLLIFKISKTFYKKCITETNHQNEQETKQDTLIKTSFNLVSSVENWPLLNGTLWDTESWTWINTIAKLRRMGLPYALLFDISLIRDQRNTSKILLKVILKNLTTNTF